MTLQVEETQTLSSSIFGLCLSGVECGAGEATQEEGTEQDCSRQVSQQEEGEDGRAAEGELDISEDVRGKSS